MKKEEYMSALRAALVEFDEELVQEIVSDYEEHFRVGAERGKSEEEVIEELGTVEDLVTELYDMLGIEPKKKAGAQTADTAGERENAEQTEWHYSNKEPYSGSIGGFIKKAMKNAEKSVKKFTKEDMKRMVKDAEEAINDIDFDGIMSDVEEAVQSVRNIDFDEIMRDAKEAVKDAEEAVKNAAEQCKVRVTYWDEEEQCWRMRKDMNKAKDGGDGESVYNSGTAETGTKKIVIQGEAADIHVEVAEDDIPYAECSQDSYKDAMMYSFYSYQKDDTFYVGLYKNKETEEHKSGFFKYVSMGSVDLTVKIPRSVEVVEIAGKSGDVNVEGLENEKLIISVMSGDVNLDEVTNGTCSIRALSGDISMNDAQAEECRMETASGDINLDGFQGNVLYLMTSSGDIRLDSTKVTRLQADAASGDITLDTVEAETAKLTSASGDIEAEEMKAGIQKYQSVNGDVTVSVSGDSDVEVSTRQGDISVSLPETMTRYRVIADTKHGDTSISGQGNRTDLGDTLEHFVKACSVNGDITIEF